jgi:STE24 endopeptidase
LIIAFTSTYNELSVAFGFEGANIGFGIILFLFIMESISIIENMILNHISRRFEYEADHYAAINTNKESMINALKVLARENYSNLNPHPLYVAIKYSHPPVAYRIRAINNITF